MTDCGDQRRSGGERHWTSHQAWIIREDGSRAEVAVTSLSGDSFRLQGGSVAVGQRLRLLVPGEGEFRIEIRWTAEDQAGGRFLD